MNRCGKNAKLEPTISDVLITIDVGSCDLHFSNTF